MSSPEELLRHAENTSSKNDTTSTRRPPSPSQASYSFARQPQATSSRRTPTLPASHPSASFPATLVGSWAGTAQMARRASRRASGRPDPKRTFRASAGLSSQPIVPLSTSTKSFGPCRAGPLRAWAASCLGWAGLGWPNGHL
jgi:hypothetical protein